MLITEWKMEDALEVAREEGIEDGIELGRAEGRAEVCLETAARMLAKGLDIQTIAECTGLTKEQLIGLQVA